MGVIGFPLLSGIMKMRGFAFGDDFFFFDSPVLEPYGNLALRQAGCSGNPPSLLFGNEFAGCIFLLQLLQLDFGVGNPLFPAPAVAADFGLERHHICSKQTGDFYPSARSLHSHHVKCLLFRLYTWILLRQIVAPINPPLTSLDDHISSTILQKTPARFIIKIKFISTSMLTVRRNMEFKYFGTWVSWTTMGRC